MPDIYRIELVLLKLLFFEMLMNVSHCPGIYWHTDMWTTGVFS